MNVDLTHGEYEALPFRDDVDGQYDPSALYRARRWPSLVFTYTGTIHRAQWEAYGVTMVLNR